MVCNGYEGSSRKIILPEEIDGHPVTLGDMTIPFNQIERFEIPEYFSEVDSYTFGNISDLQRGCTIVIHNRDAEISLPIGVCKSMGGVLSGYAGSTTQEYADSNGIRFEELGAVAAENPYSALIESEGGVTASLGDGVASYVPMDMDIVISYEDDNGYLVKRAYLGGSNGNMSIVSFRDTVPIQVTAQDANGNRLSVNKGHNNILDEGDLFWEWSGDVNGSGIGADFNLKLNSWNTLRGDYSSSATIKLCRVIKKGPFGKNETITQIELRVNRNFDA